MTPPNETIYASGSSRKRGTAASCGWAPRRGISTSHISPGQRLTHRVERNVDRERDKVVDDLVFTNCVDAVDRLERAAVPRLAWNATGDPMSTDTRAAVLRLN